MMNMLQLVNEMNNKYRFDVQVSHMLIGDLAENLLKEEIAAMDKSKYLTAKDLAPNGIIHFMGVPLRKDENLPPRAYIVVGDNEQIIGYGNL